MWVNIGLVGLGGFIGAISRFTIIRLVEKVSQSYPYGTLFVNLVGSFLIGFISSLVIAPKYTLFIGSGFLGSFTTFATVNLEMVRMGERKQYKKLFVYTVVTYSLGIMLAFVGYMIGLKLL